MERVDSSSAPAINAFSLTGPAGLFESISPPDPLSDREVSSTIEAFQPASRPTETVLQFQNADVTPIQIDAAEHQVLALMAESDLRQDDLSYVDEIAESLLVTSMDHAKSRSAIDMNFTSGVDDGEPSDLEFRRAATLRRSGLVDIGESADELFDAKLLIASPDDDDSDDLAISITVAGFAADDKRDGQPSRDVRRRNQDVRQSARQSNSAPADHSVSTPPREGMVELAHHDSSIGEEPLGQRGDPTVDTDRQRAFLKVDGSVARYQAFELAPTHKTKDSMPLSADESNTGEQSTSDVSKDASEHRSKFTGRAVVIPALLAFLSRRHSCRRRVARR